MLRISHCLDNRLTDGGKAISLKHRQRSTPQRHYFLLLLLISVRGWVNPQGLLWLEGLGKLKTFIHLTGFRTNDLPACSIVPQLRCYRVPRKEARLISWSQTNPNFWMYTKDVSEQGAQKNIWTQVRRGWKNYVTISLRICMLCGENMERAGHGLEACIRNF
jgi:hypothetical protein